MEDQLFYISEFIIFSFVYFCSIVVAKNFDILLKSYWINILQYNYILQFCIIIDRLMKLYFLEVFLWCKKYIIILIILLFMKNNLIFEKKIISPKQYVEFAFENYIEI